MIYFDNSATTQPCDASIFAANRMLAEQWFNPSSPYAQAVRVEKRIEEARACLAEQMGIAAREILFTGSGTEADSLAIIGSAMRFRPGRRVVMFAAEHPAVLRTMDRLSAMGIQTFTAPAREDGVIDEEALADILDDTVALVSCMHVNNETGAVQPVSRISLLARQKCPGALMHVDGIQAFMRLPIDLKRAGIDLYSVSAHKIHGPKGVGALAVRKGVMLSPLVVGGGQEGGLRSGTENTAGIAAFAAAVDWIKAGEQGPEDMRRIKLLLYERLRGAVDGLRVNGPDPYGETAAPHILNVSFPGVPGEVMLHALEQRGVLVGTGAACSSKKKAVRPAFSAMRAPAWAAEHAIRFSVGWMNTAEEAEMAADAAIDCWKRYQSFQRR